MFDFDCGIIIHHADETQITKKASSQPIWSRSPALQTKPRELVTAIELLTAFETKGILDLIAQFNF